MTTFEKTVDAQDPKKPLDSRNGKLDALLGRIDLLAILITLAGVGLLGVVTVVMAIVEFLKLVSSLWAESFDRWLIMAFALAVVWVGVRWKKLCVF